ncbi:Signal transduction histidine kinase [Mucilaginibacter pineti]|uniref:histidine kinase n=1 Tax=Mucilaginibacter pineti TaxID=1391627 RepID=A0A1G6TGU4_9SPHI|nr:HAMP domain-containing sensor histidine kinase [Mucilaginibacter pineti]SDD27565.1 Signal transduction histidine kinase [Mucilaginibacter pineti]
MFLSPPNLNYVKFIFRDHILWALFAFTLIFQSCSNNTIDTGDYSKEFKVIYDTVNNYYSFKNKPLIGTQYLDSTYRKLKHPFVHDRFRFYGFHYLYEKKNTHNLKKTLLYADSMLMMAKKSVTKKQYMVDYAEANFAAGDAYFSLDQYTEAYRCYYQGYYIGKSQINNEILAEYTYRMGMILFKQSHYKEAANYFKTSYKQSWAYPDDFRSFYQRQELLDNVGESYKNAGMIDSASLYFTMALKFINVSSVRFSNNTNMLEIARGVVYGNQGDIALQTHDYATAEQLLKKSININLRKGNDNRDAQLTEIKLSRLYLTVNNQQDLYKTLNNLRSQLDSLANEDAETNWNYLMSRYFLLKKDEVNALRYLKSYSSLKDSINEAANSLKRTDVNQQQANFDKQGKIDSLKDHNKLQLIYIYLAVTFSILAVVIIFLVFRNLKRSKRDVLAVKALNDQIRKQKNVLENTLEELNRGGREKDRILRAVAHDLRNPLGGIASLSDAMTSDDYTAEQMEMINLIKDTSYNSLELINEILEAANTASAKFNKDWVDISSLLNSCVELLRFKAAEKQQNIVLNLQENLPGLYINREKIWRVIGNLLSNAIKFSNKGETITVGVKDCNNGVEIAVSDAGIGIPDKLQKEVFNMFTDAKRLGTAGEKSFGLGLSICRQIIEKHNGKIWLQSNTGLGTTFYVFLPYETETLNLLATERAVLH